MLRKSPYVLENFDLFYTKEWDRSNSLLNSQESITQALNFMQNLRLDLYENSPAKDIDSGMMTESKVLDYQKSQKRQSTASNGAMIDISSQVMKGQQRQGDQTMSQAHNHQNKRSINYSAFDQTSSMLLQAPQEFFPQKKSIMNNNTDMIKQLFQNSDSQLFHPESCTYCKLHFDQILMLKHKKLAAQSNGNQGMIKQTGEQNKLEQFFVVNKKNTSNFDSSMMNSEKSMSNSTQKKNSQSQKQIQSTLFKFTNQKDKQQVAQNFNIRPVQDSQPLFHQCKCCNRTVCFNCSKHCQRCDNIICPLPLCTTVIYAKNEDIIQCNDCVSNK